jgi:hypothetical protein
MVSRIRTDQSLYDARSVEDGSSPPYLRVIRFHVEDDKKSERSCIGLIGLISPVYFSDDQQDKSL